MEDIFGSILEDIYLGCLKFLIFFLRGEGGGVGGGGGGGGVNGRCWARAYI